MKNIEKRFIDWSKTSKNLKFLRLHNDNLQRYVCWKLNYNKQECSGDCLNCILDRDFHISQSELSQVFNVSESMVTNWETAKSRPSLEDLIFYSEICGIDLFEVIVLENK